MVRRPVDGRTFRIRANRPLATDRRDADSVYETLVASDPGAAILDLYGATETTVDAIIEAHVSEASPPDSWRDGPYHLSPDLLEEYSRGTWVRAQRASLAAIQIITEDALQAEPIPLRLPDVAFPAGDRAGAPVVFPFQSRRAHDVFIEAEFALPALPSPFQVGAEVEAGFRGVGWSPREFALVPVANTPRLPLAGSVDDVPEVPRRLVNLAERALVSLYGCSRPHGADLFPTHIDYQAEDYGTL
jgi:hypothetical protein